MRRRHWMTAAAGALALTGLAVLSACGGEDDGPPATLVPAGQAEIDQDNLKFNPSELIVSAGDPVRFVNSETALHTVSIDGDNMSGNMKKGDVFEWTAAEPGEYRISCEYHAQMRATITVQ